MNEDLYRGTYRIDSVRLSSYDYGSNGIYFITICTQNRESYFGEVVPIVETQHLASHSRQQTPFGYETQDVASLQHTIKPTPIGQAAIDCWFAIPDHFPFVMLDAFQVMPNHVHGILWISKPTYDDWQPNTFGPQCQNLASIIRGYKVGVKKHAIQHQSEFAWQPRYYDRIVRNLNELDRIRTYIENNPNKWVDDQNNPENLYM